MVATTATELLVAVAVAVAVCVSDIRLQWLVFCFTRCHSVFLILLWFLWC